MLYPILVEYYVWWCIALLVITWFTRVRTGQTRTNLMYFYGMLAAIGFLLDLDWMGGVIFGLIVLELGKKFKAWLDAKQASLK
ncbi:hypothetical protein DN730_12240 [Marinomonas piezotolerans]|uniref:Permease n=1 Tax=Marinomonas piezotolerans TaxID=2213058 RepID=A0A370U870_9GAMM|nr:hypothetical protein [Marinomonas piezotolerans]RDL43943.1 hypothetical protein DN730_12240 [Marinomonas piezotolerans]